MGQKCPVNDRGTEKMTNEQNTFEKVDASNIHKEKVQPNEEPVSDTSEISMDNFSDVAVGDITKYVRPDLHGQKDVVDKFQIFMPDFDEEPSESQAKTSHYWKVRMILTYKSVNSDEIHNREYISGAKIFRQQDGTPNPNVNFWYAGSENQAAYLWEKVAEAKKIKPEELSPREFVAFLNSKPKVDIVGKKYKNYKAPAGAPAMVTKNMPGVFN